jgi:ferrous iron transport protein A
MLPLTRAKVGEQNIIKKIGGGAEIHRFLQNLGFVVGASLTLVADISGNVIVAIKESRVAISSEMACKIYV